MRGWLGSNLPPRHHESLVATERLCDPWSTMVHVSRPVLFHSPTSSKPAVKAAGLRPPEMTSVDVAT